MPDPGRDFGIGSRVGLSGAGWDGSFTDQGFEFFAPPGRSSTTLACPRYRFALHAEPSFGAERGAATDARGYCTGMASAGSATAPTRAKATRGAAPSICSRPRFRNRNNPWVLAPPLPSTTIATWLRRPSFNANTVLREPGSDCAPVPQQVFVIRMPCPTESAAGLSRKTRSFFSTVV